MTSTIFIQIDQPIYIIGFDFLISLKKNDVPVNFSEGKLGKEGKAKRKTPSPGFEDIYADLEIKKQENINEFQKVIPIIYEIYDCNDIDISKISKNLHFDKGLPIEVVFKLIKWLFVEQDLRYWNYSGRATFLEYMKNLFQSKKENVNDRKNINIGIFKK